MHSLHTAKMKRLSITSIAVGLLLVPVTMGAPSEPKELVEPKTNETAEQKERVSEKQNPQQPPQVTFPFPFFPFRPDASLTPGRPPFTFPFLFPSLSPRPSFVNLARSVDLPLPPAETFLTSVREDELRKTPTADKKKPKKNKKKQQKKPKTPKPMAAYQKENQIALEMPIFPPALAGNIANGNQGSYTGYYMVYLVEVRWNGSNETQTIIAGRPVIAANPSPTEAAQMTGALMTEDPLKPAGTTQCLFQRSTTADLSDLAKPPGPTNQPDQEIISEEMEIGDDYYDDDPKKKKKEKAQKKSKTDAPVTHPTQ